MINFIYGRSANAKLEHISKMIADDHKKGIRSFLIVPEQFSVHSERHMLRALPPSAQLTLEILNFSRLYDRVCRDYGGIEYNYATNPLKYAIMWQNLRELEPNLSVYRKLSADTGSLCDMMLSATGEFKSCGIKSNDLEKVAKALGNTPLAKKLLDLSLIYASYNALIENSFSDSADDVSKLYDKLLKHDFFSGANVYIDSFTSFTGVEYKIIEQIFKTAANITITIPLEAPRAEALYNKSIIDCEARLTKSAKKYGEINEITVPSTIASADDIKYLADNLWSSSKETKKDKTYVSDSVHLVKCSSPYTEAEAAAATVLGLLREGKRCRDIVVLMRDADAYRGIIEPAFDKCDIPYHFSEKTDLSTTPIVKFILSAIRIGIYNWNTADVISHLKCALYNTSDDDLDLFEQYVTTWQIRGNRFTSGEFTMNADGYVPEEPSKRAIKIRDAANRVRKLLCDSILTLLNDIDKATDTAQKIRAIYSFLSRSGVEKKLEELSKKEKENGNQRTAEEYSRLFGITCDALSDLVKVIDENDDFCQDLSLNELCELLTVYFSKNEIGSIPSSADQVIIGSASMMRTGEPKCVLMLGMCEGVFPAPVTESGILSFSEKKLISEKSNEAISFSGSVELASSDELMYVQRSVESATEKLYMFCHTSSTDGRKTMPSLPFTRAGKLFSNNVKYFSGKDLTSFTPSLSSSIQYLDKISDKELKAALKLCISEDEKYSKLISEKRSPISDVNCSVSPETAQSVFPDKLKLSQSKIDKFVKCNFSYYCSYVLKLREEHISRFKSNDIGTFIHYILEKLLSEVVTEDGVSPELTNEKLQEMISRVVEEYIVLISPPGTPRTARLSHLYKRLEKLSTLLVQNIIEEFRHSAFRPEYFELETNGEGDNPAPHEFVLNDKQTVVFSGTIDRVDLLRKDGKVYIRVVDYKTGTKQFSLEDIEYGLNVQMLLYLFTLTNNKSEAFKKKIGSNDFESAGILYLSSGDASNALSLGDYKKEDEVFSEAQKGIERSGLLLENEEILLAMNDELSKDFLAGITKKVKKEKGQPDVEVLSGKALASAALFESIEKDIERVIKRIAEEMYSGAASAIPINYKKNDPCKYCTMKPICRIKDSAKRR